MDFGGCRSKQFGSAHRSVLATAGVDFLCRGRIASAPDIRNPIIRGRLQDAPDNRSACGQRLADI